MAGGPGFWVRLNKYLLSFIKNKKPHFGELFFAGHFFLKVRPERRARTRRGVWHTIRNDATNLGRSKGEVCKLKQGFKEN